MLLINKEHRAQWKRIDKQEINLQAYNLLKLIGVSMSEIFCLKQQRYHV